MYGGTPRYFFNKCLKNKKGLTTSHFLNKFQAYYNI
jgi:hypothetical protein